MSLTKYNKKRRFAETSEPEAKPAKKTKPLMLATSEPLRFVVQKHAASHLHYDFRLEMRGTLKSWAVPKGPSLNPADKRLAMMVEDHPFEYRTFEGIIPEGNYGGGTVIIWDEGTFEPLEPAGTTKEEHEKQLMAMLKKGDLKVVLKGSKLKGAYALVQMKGRQENAWLLIKKADKYASEDDVTTKTKSVVSKLTIEQMASKHGVDTPKSAAKKTATKMVAAKKTATKKVAAQKAAAKKSVKKKV